MILTHPLAGLLILFAAIALGCSRTNSPSAPTDIQTDIADYTAIDPIVKAQIAEGDFPPPVAWSMQRPKADEATATIEYGDKQKKVLTLKKHDGKWAIDREE